MFGRNEITLLRSKLGLATERGDAAETARCEAVVKLDEEGRLLAKAMGELTQMAGDRDALRAKLDAMMAIGAAP